MTMLVYWLRLVAWWVHLKRQEWRVEHYPDGRWYVEVDHLDHGWEAQPESGSERLIDAAAWGRRRYSRPVR